MLKINVPQLIVNNDISDFRNHLGLLTRPSSLLDSSSIDTLPFSMEMCTLSDDKIPLLHSKYGMCAKILTT